MKKLLLATLAAAFVLALSGCGNDNNIVLYPTKGAITFAAMSTAGPFPSSSTGVQYVAVAGALPAFVNISTTTAAGPTSGQFPPIFSLLPLDPASKRISASALVKAGVFANNSSVSKRTKITGLVSTDTIQNVKRVSIFLAYSSPRTPGAPIVSGRSVDFATLNVTFPAGSPISQEIIQEMNKALWEYQPIILPGINFWIINLTPALINSAPTISSVILGY